MAIRWKMAVNLTARFSERKYFRFYTDRYIKGSSRDLDMELGTKRIIWQYFMYRVEFFG